MTFKYERELIDTNWFIPLVVVMVILTSWFFLPRDAVAATMPPAANLCTACHGVNGKSTAPGYPNLAGQDKLYIITQLEAFRDKTRTGGSSEIMYPMATGLTDEQIEKIAEYFSEL